MTTASRQSLAIDNLRQAIGQRKIAGEEITRAITEARHLLKSSLAPLMCQYKISAAPEAIAKRLFHKAHLMSQFHQSMSV